MIEGCAGHVVERDQHAPSEGKRVMSEIANPIEVRWKKSQERIWRYGQAVKVKQGRYDTYLTIVERWTDRKVTVPICEVQHQAPGRKTWQYFTVNDWPTYLGQVSLFGSDAA